MAIKITDVDKYSYKVTVRDESRSMYHTEQAIVGFMPISSECRVCKRFFSSGGLGGIVIEKLSGESMGICSDCLCNLLEDVIVFKERLNLGSSGE